MNIHLINRYGRAQLLVMTGIFFVTPSVLAAEYQFDNHLLAGAGYMNGVDLSRFDQKEQYVAVGRQVLDIKVNGETVGNKLPVMFKKTSLKTDSAQPCLDNELLKVLDFKSITVAADSQECTTLADLAPQAMWTLQSSTLTLEFFIPKTLLNNRPRDYIPVTEWQAGVPVLFLRHDTSLSRDINRSAHTSYLWSMINAGINAGMWQLRHQANARYMDSSYSGEQYRWNSVRTWLQRPLPAIASALIIGETYTPGSMFGSLAFTGVKLATDQRMWPSSRRGYAPEVRGTANTNARVVISQRGNIIYETQVPPGPFLIRDLYNTRSEGDLQVQVLEADGRTSYFTVPYAAVPESMRPGNLSYQFAAGKVRDYNAVANTFSEAVVQYGLHNRLTTNSGIRVANDYQAMLLGGVWATDIGALGLNTTWSHASVENGRTLSGWRVEASYSKSFSTNTNLVLAAYRYSTSGYRDLGDVLGVRRQEKNGVVYYSDSLNQRNRFIATLSQNMFEYGSLALSGSTTDYYNNSSRITEMNLSYSNSWKKLSYNLNLARQQTSFSSANIFSVNDISYDPRGYKKQTENVITLGISIPLDWRDSGSMVSFDFSKSKDATSATTSLSGSAGKEKSFSYSLYSSYDRYRNYNHGYDHNVYWGGNAQQQTRFGAVNGSYSQSSGYKRIGLGASGTLALHSGGLTYGPYTSETFAIVEAKGAEGARVKNSQGTKIDIFGYAIVPSLTPYRYNVVGLDGETLDDSVEIEGGSTRLVPVSGAVAKVKFNTISGTPTVITAKQADGQAIPMGAEVIDHDGNVIGMTGQGGQVYVRLPNMSGTVFVTWGDNRRCQINYQLPAGIDKSSAIVNIAGVCI